MTTLHRPSTPASAPLYDSESFRRFTSASGELTEANWKLALEVARQQSVSELKALLDLGLVGEDTLADRLAAWSGRSRWKPDAEQASPTADVPEQFMRLSGALVLEDAADGEPSAPRLVVSDPSDHFALSSLLARFGPAAPVQIGTQKDILRFLDDRRSAPAAGAASDEPVDVSSELSQLRDMASEAPVVRFFNQAVERAMDAGASDIHLERFDRRVSLRFRVDGILIDQPPPQPGMYDPILCRIKIMANLDIAERRRSQDGRIPMRLRGRTVDLRVSIVPTMYGQDAAIRLQDRQRLAEIELSDLGFAPEHVTRLIQVANKSHGILLITGPTGSGKTTTLYALLRKLVSPELKIITVEDPVEYAMDGVNQIQVNNAVNLTFGNTLRNVLRHDPDVILIGEIRDKETAEIAFQASLTGHMVLSTLHTNDVPSTFVRLVDMGVEPYLVNAAVEAVTAQRLLRKTCPACRNEPPARDTCKTCTGIGYRGRVAVMEYSGITSEVKRYMIAGAEEHRIRESLLRAGYLPMRAEAERLVAAGVTDEPEVVRVLGAAAALLDHTDENHVGPHAPRA
jgi:general secretion pathway protein E